ncbi:MAG: TonB-dependent receptor [Haliea sp.]
MKRRLRPIAVYFAPFIALPPILATAQPMLEEVVVTARKKVETLQDSPVAVSVVSGTRMRETGITNLEQVSATVPGLQLGRGVQTSSIYIRGIGSGLNRGFEQSAGMYLDGIYQARSRQFTQSLVDLDRVEVLRGPQSLLFGKNTIAGAIKVESASPVIGGETEGSLTVDVEPEFNTARITGVISGSPTDTLAARLAVRYQESDGYVENVFLDKDAQEREDKLFRLSLAWSPTPDFEATAKISRTEFSGKGTELSYPSVSPDLLNSFFAGQSQLPITSVMASIAAFAVPGFDSGASGNAWQSWNGNPAWTPRDIDETDSTQVSLSLAWDLGDYTLTALTGYTDFESLQDHDTDFHPGQVVHNIDNEELTLFSQELRLNSNFDGRFNFSAGVYYEEQDSLIDSLPFLDGSLGGVWGALPAAALIPSAPPGSMLSDFGIDSLWNGAVLASMNPAAAPLIGAQQDVIWRNSVLDGDSETLAVFVEFNLALTDTLYLDLGARYSKDSKDALKKVSLGVGAPHQEVTVINPDGSPTAALDAQNSALVGTAWSLIGTFPALQPLSRDEEHFDPLARLRWEFSPNAMAYLSYTEGYKSGGFNSTGDTALPDGSPGPGTEFEDELAKAWELGLKGTTSGGRARWSAIAFRTEIEDLQVTSFRGTSFLVGNAASTLSQGLELEGSVALTESFTLDASLAYLDSEYQDFKGAACTVPQTAIIGSVGCTQDFSGRRGPNAPEWSGTVNVNYYQPMGNHLALRANAQLTYKSEYFVDSDLDPNSLQQGYTKLNLSMGIGAANDKWSVSVYARNLTDKDSYSMIVDSPFSAGIYAGFVEEPRVVGLQAQYNLF